MNDIYQINNANVEAAREDYRAFIEESKHPAETGETLLRKILRDNMDTEYGRKYGFADIQSYEAYKARVPVITYDNIAAEVNRMVNGEKNILTAYPCTHMNITSGTVGAPKYIPMTAPQLQVFLKYNKHYMDAFYAEKLGDAWMDGKIFCTAQGTSRTAESGITIGDASAVMASYVQGGRQGLDTQLRRLYTSPVEAAVPLPGTDARYLHARFALAEKNITGIVTAFYVMLVQYLHYIGENYTMLIHDIETGTIDTSIELPEEARASLAAKIVPMPERAAELREIFKNGSNFKFAKSIWPKLCFVYGVGGDGFSPYAATLRRLYIDDSVTFLLAGICASEGLWSVPVDIDSEDAALVPGSAFMEFLPVEAGDDFSRCVTMDKLELGKTYEIIATTLGGLYRYRMSDAVKVTSFFNRTPRVRFMYRVNKTVSLAAEKTTEKALQQAVERTAGELGFALSDFTIYPDAHAVPPRYVFLIQPELPVTDISREQLEATVYKHLREANAGVAILTDEGRLQAPQAFWLQPQTTFLWRDLQLAKGKSVGQLKPLRVIANEEQKKFFFILRDL